MKLTDSEKLDLINTMEFIDFDADCEGIVYVLVEDNDKNRGILHKIGLTNEDIEKDCFVEDGTMDVSMVASRYSNYYNAKEGVFYNEDEVYGVIEEVKQTLSLLEDIKRREKELGISGPDLDMQIESEKTKLEALEKQIPKKVVRSIKAKIISHNCPRCGRLFWEYRNGYCSEYCSVCGQRLDWIQAENE